MRYRITVSYDGSGFCGWQSQAGGGSVQDAIESAVLRLTGEKARVTGSGRTDAGVHAIAQVAHFDCVKELPPERIVGGLNAYLPSSVRVTDAIIAEPAFDARKSAKQKTYVYVMYEGAALPVLNGRALNVPALDVTRMEKAAEAIVGTHDFASFRAANGGAKTSVRTVYAARFERVGRFIKFYITADGFLYNMVRIIVAQLIRVGKGEEIDMEYILGQKDRSLAKDTAPAGGLYLLEVEYK